jgi:C4-dicarboxylate transporter DctM subunit
VDTKIALDAGAGAEATGPVRRAGRLAVRSFDTALSGAVGTLLAVLVVVALFQVLMRYGFNQPALWPEEVIRWSFLWLVFLGTALAVRGGDHIRIDALANALPGRFSTISEVVVAALTALALGSLVVQGYAYATQTTVLSASLGLTLMGAYLAVPVGSALAVINLARKPVHGAPRWVSTTVVIVAALLAWPIDQLPLTMFAGLNTSVLLLVASFALIAMGVPIAYAMLLGSFVTFWANGLPTIVVVTRLSSMVFDNYTLVAVAFFLFMGSLMNVGGITSALVRAASALVGHWRGGLAQVNIATSLLMGGLSGSSSADTASVTKTLVPEMERQGYTRAYACSVTASSSLIANLLPPSIMLIIYASLARTSVGALFMAGVIPAFIITGSLVATVWLTSKLQRHAPTPQPRAPLREIIRAVGYALPGLALPVMILGALRMGVVTPTEAGALAALYTLLLGIFVYRTVTPRRLITGVGESGRQTSAVLILVACTAPAAWLLTTDGAPQAFAQAMSGLTDHYVVFMLMLLLLLLAAGLPLEAAPAMVILVPILLPITGAAGIHPIHLGVIMTLALMIGSLTPPVGALTFITASIADIPVVAVFRALFVFEVALILALLVISFVPQTAMWLPGLFGY